MRGDARRNGRIKTGGAILGTFTLDGTGSLDYEDIAICPGPLAGVSYLYLALQTLPQSRRFTALRTPGQTSI